MSDWKEYKLKELVVVNERSIGRNFNFEEIEYIDTSSVTENKFELPSFTTLKDAPSRAKRLIRDGDTIISTVRPVQKHYGYVKKSRENQVVSTGFAVVTPKKIDPRFLYYFLIQPEITEYLNTIAEGGTTTFPAFRADELNDLNIKLPDHSTQTAIAEILSTLDDKIELNNKINHELETLAQTLFKQWFIDFEFPNENGEPYKSSGGEMVYSELGEIPKGWKVNPIESLTEKMNSGGTPSTRRDDYYDGNIKWFSTKELKDSYLFESERMISQAGLDNSSAKVFPANTVLMAIYAAPTVGRLGILTEEATFNQAALGFIAKEEVGFEYVFLLLKHLRYDLNNLANGAAQQNLNVGLVKNYNIVHPTIDILSSFRQIVSSIFLSIKINQEEINTLKLTRDTLLPKLISGELEINEISN